MVFAITTAVYCGIWIYYIRLLPQGTIGVAFRPYSPEAKQFFRDEYDAPKILEDLAGTIRTARSCSELALLLEEQIRQASRRLGSPGLYTTESGLLGTGVGAGAD